MPEPQGYSGICKWDLRFSVCIWYNRPRAKTQRGTRVMSTFKNSHVLTVAQLVAMEVTMQPRQTSEHDLRDDSTPKLNECVHHTSNHLGEGGHVAADWSVTYAEVEVIGGGVVKPFLHVRRGAINEGVCNAHLKDVAENIKDYYEAELEKLVKVYNEYMGVEEL